MTVTVVGLLPGQAKRVERLVPNLRLRFIPADRAHHVYPDGLSVLMAKFISHDTQDRARKRGNVVVHRGGIKGLVERLEKMAG